MSRERVLQSCSQRTSDDLLTSGEYDKSMDEASAVVSAASPRKRLHAKTKQSSAECQAHLDIEPSRGKRLCMKRPAASLHSRGYVEGALVQAEDLARMATPSAPSEGCGDRSPRVAIVLCSKGCPAARLREWLFWHISMGVSMIYMCWEGPMDVEQKEALEGPISRGELELKRVSRETDSAFNPVMTRQVKFVQNKIHVARKCGFDFLLHIDDDELLCPLHEGATVVDIFRRYVGSPKRCIHFENYEANFEFAVQTLRPFTRSSTKFRTDNQALYCNGKSAANLALSPIYASGVHSFCEFDRCFEEPDPAYGDHDNGGGCTHPDCCATVSNARILHFDSPSFEEWHSKFMSRAAATLKQADEEEMACFPFKKKSISILRKKPAASVKAQEKVYKDWRCISTNSSCKWSRILTGADIEKRFTERLELCRTKYRAALS